LNGKIINKVSPADGRDLSGLCACAGEDINNAVAAAKNSFNLKIYFPCEKH